MHQTGIFFVMSLGIHLFKKILPVSFTKLENDWFSGFLIQKRGDLVV